jgi:hypothetical protein
MAPGIVPVCVGGLVEGCVPDTFADRARLVFAVDATANRKAAWKTARRLTFDGCRDANCGLTGFRLMFDYGVMTPDEETDRSAPEPLDEVLLGAILPRRAVLEWQSLIKKQGKTQKLKFLEWLASDFEEANESPPPELAHARAQIGPNGRSRRTRRVP